MSKALSSFGGGLVAGLGAGAILDFGKDTLKAASDVEQSFGGLDAVFKGTSGRVKQFADAAAAAVGLSKSQYATFATGLGSQLKGLGMSADAAADQTNTLIERAADLAATYGGTTSQAVEAFGAVMRGEYDPIQKYAGAINDATVMAGLHAKGQDKLTGSALLAAKQQEALRQIFDLTKDSAGKYRAELDTTAGSTQQLSADTENLKADIGKELQPAYNDMLKLLKEQFLPFVKNDLIPTLTEGGPLETGVL